MMTFEIDEQESGKYLVYSQKAEDQIDRLVVGMVENNKIPGIIGFVKSQVDTQISYRYDITGMVSVAEYFSDTISKHKLISVLEGILTVMNELEDYMLEIDAAVLDTGYIYVNPEDESVKLILLPVKHENMPLNIFLRNMIFSVRYDSSEDVSYVTALLNYFNSAESFSVIGFGNLIHGLKNSNPNTPQKSPYNVTPNAPQKPAYAAMPNTPQKPAYAAMPNAPQKSAYAATPNAPQKSVYAATPNAPQKSAYAAMPNAPQKSSYAAIPNAPQKSSYAANPNASQYASQYITDEKKDTVVMSGEEQAYIDRMAGAADIQEPGTTILSVSAYQNINNNGKKYVNPNLVQNKGNVNTYPGNSMGGRQSNPMGGQSGDPMNGHSGNPMSGQSGNPVGAQSGNPVKGQTGETKNKNGLFGKKDNTEKSGGGFFDRLGKKKDESALNSSGGEKAKSFRGIAIPGSDVVSTQTSNQMADVTIPAQNVQMDVHDAPIQNFGETVDLQSFAAGYNGGVKESGYPADVMKLCLIRKATRERYQLTKEMTRIGRNRENVDIYITDNTSIGRVHAIIYRRDGHIFIEDQNSRNGTFVNGRQITGQAELRPGMTFRLSNESFELNYM